MSNNTTIKRYAIALFEVACERNLETKVLDDLLYIQEVMQSVPKFEYYLSSKKLPTFLTGKFLNDLINKFNIQKTTAKTIDLMIKYKKFSDFSAFVRFYKDLLNQKQSITHVKMVMAKKADEAKINDIKMQLSSLLNGEIDLDLTYDSNLIAGTIFIVGDKIVDCSLKTYLGNLQSSLDEIIKL